MKRAVVLAALVALLTVAARRPGRAQGTAPPTELTVYSHDFALVRQTRPVSLATGVTTLRLDGIPHQIDPASILASLPGGGASVVGQGYDLGVADQRDWLRRHVGEPVEWVRYRPDGREGRREAARLVALDDEGHALLEVDGKLYANPPGTLAVPLASPAAAGRLELQVDSPTRQAATLSLGYLTRGLSWTADYVLTLPAGGAGDARLEGFGTVTNQTGVTFPAAQVTLVAGEPNRAAQPTDEPRARAASDRFNAMAKAAAPVPTAGSAVSWDAGERPTPAGDDQAFPIARPVTVASDRLTRLRLFHAESVKVVRDLSFTAPPLSPWMAGGRTFARATVGLALRNSRASGLGEPLPAGTLRAYQADGQAHLQYLGASPLKQLAADDRADLTLGRTFDLRVEHRVVSIQPAGEHRRVVLEMVVTNTSRSTVDARLVQPVETDRFAVAEESCDHELVDPHRVAWTVTVPAGGSTTLRCALSVW